MTKYADFLAGKDRVFRGVGFDPPELNSQLFDFQRDIVRWALRKGRAAIFADCGLGKTPMQLEWAHQVAEKTGRPVLILTPLAVAVQTVKEGTKFHTPATIAASDADVTGPGIYVTNYQKLHHFTPDKFGGIVLDESSILKAFDGVTRKALTDFTADLNYRLCCTATPAPNDLIELTNHAEFLGVATGKEIVGRFFIQDGNTTHKFRLRNYAVADFYRWLASWSVAMRSPHDLGYEDRRFELPPLHIHHHQVEIESNSVGLLFDLPVSTLQERRDARRNSIEDRVEMLRGLIAASPEDEQWLIWTDLNAESKAVTTALDGAVEVEGSDTDEHKIEAMRGFSDGEVRILVTKPKIAGFGMNWQGCRNVVFFGLSDSYEAFYQAIRRCWRFGQERDVHCHIITSHLEHSVTENIKRKEAQATGMFDALVKHMRPYEEINMEKTTRKLIEESRVKSGDGWKLYNGDSILLLPQIETESVGLTIFSPPFPGMYAYTDSPQDVGNCANFQELLDHFDFMIDDLLRVTMPGRSCAIHLTQEPVFKGKDGYTGLRDFRGDVIRRMQDHGWIYYGEVTIDKDPQVKASRTKDHSLLFKTLGTDSTHCRMALADYLLQFRKPGDNPLKVPSGTHPRWNPNGGWITADEWIEWAAPVWYRKTPDYPGGIAETDVLNVRAARSKKDERHLCPLQLGVIERAVKLWSAPGDLVLSPFAGIGSEGVVSLRFGRRFVGIELKPEYWEVACENLATANAQTSMFQE